MWHTPPLSWYSANSRKLIPLGADAIQHRSQRRSYLWNDVLYWSRSEEHTSELQSLMRISYAVFCLKKKKKRKNRKKIKTIQTNIIQRKYKINRRTKYHKITVTH